MAKYGHVTGYKKERASATAWYKEQEEANIRKVEAEWQARHAQACPHALRCSLGHLPELPASNA
jgi:hypothetical protein